ncbi:MAG: hypothetical protein R3A79_28610 [Nannocystaceae bacterium]
MPTTKSALIAIGLLLTASACGDGDKAKTRNSIAKAFENADPEAAAKEATRDMKRLKERTAAKAEQAVREAIDALTIVPDGGDIPTDLAGACDAMRQAYDDFVQRRLAGKPDELERWNVFKPMDLDKARDECLANKDVDVARCQAHALTNASPREITKSRATEIMTRCGDKFGNKLGARPSASAVQPS